MGGGAGVLFAPILPPCCGTRHQIKRWAAGTTDASAPHRNGLIPVIPAISALIPVRQGAKNMNKINYLRENLRLDPGDPYKSCRHPDGSGCNRGARRVVGAWVPAVAGKKLGPPGGYR